ncbi:hypothetical protein DFQ03_1305 [Maribacter caenipelagi]|uniref:DUF4136 domain-containing protein n=1 Tax=Maribacter caenipelagi TaxID=1447781 RepID=A0A4R7D812_9FLAO|nr:hypothetical protein [Maribacter caenipelagi]TDS16817.1 hypothetical protein DFQ03_1305 [Maribacter caenipelagi]
MMKKTGYILMIVLLTACSSTRFIDSWKNKEITVFKPEKMLVIGMTNNLTARKIFEEELKDALYHRGINAVESTREIGRSFTDSQKNLSEIDTLKKELLNKGYDAIAITAVVGIDDKQDYSSGYYTIGNNWYRFGRYYYRFQNVYYTPEYYSNYKIFHIETSIYNLKTDDDESLVWVGTFDIVDPNNITSIIEDYVKRIMLQLEKEGIIK